MRGAASLLPAILVLLVSFPLAQGTPSPPVSSPGDPVAPSTSSAEVPPQPPPGPRSDLGTIVVDPGHGGDDVGVVGMGGTQEKALTLAIAQRLKTTLETQLGVRVVLTRTDDRAVGLDQRAAVANNSRADLFLSLHLNASAVAEMTGAEVFHQRLSRDGEGALRRAGRGASVLPVFGGAPRTIEVVRWDLAHTRHVARSTLLADLLQEQLGMRVAMSPRPNREAPLRVLTSVDMPATLIEMAYLTNSGQEGEIQSDAYQTSLVGAIADAVAQFRSSVDEREAQ